MIFRKLTILMMLLSVSIFGCSKEDKKMSVTCDGSNLAYNTGISSIINANCNNSSCHGSNSPHGSFTTYSGLQGVISNGAFNSQVIVNQTMPQGSSLTQSELNKLKCWVDNGYPEN